MPDSFITAQWHASYRRTFAGASEWQPDTLRSSCNVKHVTFGTGCSIYTNSILPAVERATSEVIIVTCFWARSHTLDRLNESLLTLSRSSEERGQRVRVRICFSSSSFTQKLFHTAALCGRSYSSSEMTRTLGLLPAEELRGIDLQVKSIFVRPFSVMHPKFIVVDRSTVLLPSCNVSWEDWFEGCIEMTGPLVQHFVGFWTDFWAGEQDRDSFKDSAIEDHGISSSITSVLGRPPLLASISPTVGQIPAVFLPSPHHRNPKFALPWKPCPPPPPTPLNTYLLTALSNASKTIYIQTPNLTSPPVLSALLGALRRGTNVEIVTSKRLMILEQLVTAGTTTTRCVKKLIKRHNQLLQDWQVPITHHDLESSAISQPGSLSVKFYTPDQRELEFESEPVQSHVKVTILDDEVIVFGSGNMDRASWYTSQELSVAFSSPEVAQQIRDQLRVLMVHRRK